jgi:hypothetical protein
LELGCPAGNDPLNAGHVSRGFDALIKTTDSLASRYSLFDAECRAVLEGVRDEEAFKKVVNK